MKLFVNVVTKVLVQVI